MHCADEPL